MSEIKEVKAPGTRQFKFSDSFLVSFKTLMSAYDKKIEELHNISSLIDKDAHHGVCNCSYKMRYITPENVSTFISNLEKAMSNHLLKPKMGDCDLFAVSSVKKFLDGNGCVPFDAFSLMGNPGADIPKGATLADLTFAAENEVFNVIVYSKYELEQRAKDMKDDIKKIQDMHFSAAIKAFVDKLPGIMDSKAKYVMNDALIYVAMERYIEDFIMFALRLNYTTICQMIGYAVPRVAYKIEPESDDSNESANNADNWDEDDEFFKQEAADLTKVSPVFFIFTQGKGIIPAAIKKATDSEYSHVSISFDAGLENMYSFGTTGFRTESIHDKKRSNLNICVFGTFVSKDGVKKMKDICEDFKDHIDNSKFSYSSLIKKLFGKDNPSEGEYKEICTTFVNKCLASIDNTLTDKEIPSPKEMKNDAESRQNQVFKLFEGNSTDYKKAKASKMLKKMGKDKSTKKFDNLVTECCCGFLKSNDYIITNKIPFNCNMRDIVLQDMHPTFKDTISALKFIMNDERSPVHQLVIQYFTEPIEDYDPDLVVKMFLGCCHKDLIDPMIGLPDMGTYEKLKNTAASMNTDVNWLDKITYGNMFYDGNYRRDALGNNKVRPIMNSFETIYKMFGGCDNATDNTCLANNMIRISRIMKAIICKYEEGCICDWELCRDILSVFGEIFTRNMLRLYYNNSSRVLTSDQMEDAMGPGYMFAEGYVLEAGEFTHNKQDGDRSAGNMAKVGLRKILEAMAKWVRETLSTFMPNFFKNNYQKQCEWFNKNGEAKYNEVMNGAENGYKLPTKKTFYRFKVSCAPEKIKADEILRTYLNDNSKDLNDEKVQQEIKEKLMDMFNDQQIAKNLSVLKGEQLQKSFINAILYCEPVEDDKLSEGVKTLENHQIEIAEFTDVYKRLVFLCKNNGFDLTKDFQTMSNSLAKGLEELKNNTTEGQVGGNQGNQNNGQQQNNNADAKNKRIEVLNNIVSEISKNCYVAAENAIVKKLFPETYNTFKGVVDDYETMKNNGTSANNNNGNQNNSTATDTAGTVTSPTPTGTPSGQ